MAKFSAGVAEVVANVRDPYLVDRPDFDSMLRAVRTLDEQLTEARRQLTTCTCGSGAHPRPCYVHPDAYARHIAEIEADNQRDWREAHDKVEAELTEARAEIAALRGLPEGAVSSGWSVVTSRSAQYRVCWARHVPGVGVLRAEADSYGDAYWGRLHGGDVLDSGAAPTLRDAMRAADAALAGGGS